MMCTLILVLLTSTWAGEKTLLKLVQSTPLPELKDGDFDHFTVDLAGNRLFSTAEENEKVLVFDLKTNKLIHTIDGLKAPHSMLYRADLKKLFVVDGDLGELKIYDSESYKPAGSVKLREGADSSTMILLANIFMLLRPAKTRTCPTPTSRLSIRRVTSKSPRSRSIPMT
jgi:NMD protein affecting ribosome stability and mRNA decay